MNEVTLDGCVQKDVNLFDEVASFNISAITGTYMCMNTTKKNRFTYLRIIFPQPIDEYLEDIIQPGSMVRIHGKLDSEQYITKNNKIVYNKVICADKVVRIKYDKDYEQYVEVI